MEKKLQKKFFNIKESDLENLAKEVLLFVKDFFEKNKDKRFCVIFLKGELGAGKTTFTKYFAKILGLKENIISPTFILRKDYNFSLENLDSKDLKMDGVLIHIDGYRFENIEEAKVLALDKELNLENFSDLGLRKIILIEWPERFKDYYNLKANLEINIDHLSEKERNILIKY